jgi:hypothetical protein
MGAGSRTLCATEEGISLRGRRPPVEVAHLDLRHLDSIVFVLLVVHLEGWCQLPGGLCRTRKCHKGGIGGDERMVGAERFEERAGSLVSQHRLMFLALVKERWWNRGPEQVRWKFEGNKVFGLSFRNLSGRY